MSVSDHRQLVVWQKGIELALETYRLSKAFPREETYGLSSQIRRAAVSVPANIAEGNGRTHRREYANHVSMARGSLREVETLAEIARGLSYISDEELAAFRELLDHVGRMLTSLLKRLEA
jgi:four helix bundle protein